VLNAREALKEYDIG